MRFVIFSKAKASDKLISTIDWYDCVSVEDFENPIIKTLKHYNNKIT